MVDSFNLSYFEHAEHDGIEYLTIAWNMTEL